MSGLILDGALKSANIDRAACLQTFVYDTKLEENLVARERSKRGSSWDAFHEGNLDRLAAELQKAGPNVVVPMGTTALNALKGSTSIQKLRGQPTMGEGRFANFKLVPTFDPNFIVKQYHMSHVLIGDLNRAAAEAEIGPHIEYPRRLLNVAPSIGEVEAYVETAAGAPLLSCDIETWFNPDNDLVPKFIRGVSFAHSEEEAIYVPFISMNTLTRCYWPDVATERRAWDAVRAILHNPVPKLGQNFGSFDAPWLLSRMGIRVRNYCHDLRLLHKTLYPELPASLQFMGNSYSRQGSWKHWSKESGVREKARGAKRDE